MARLIKRGSGEANPATRTATRQKKTIIEREVVGATSEAKRIIEEAEVSAQEILDAAREQASVVRENGFEEGRQEALAKFTQKMTEALRGVRALENQIEPQYIALVRTCVEEIIGQEIALEPSRIVDIVRSALDGARQQREVIVRVHPDDRPALEENQRRLLEKLARAPGIEIREDQSIDRGGCVVATELGTINATLERQLDALEAALQSELSESRSGPQNSSFESAEVHDGEE